MDLNFTPEEEAFRAEVRAFLAGELPRDISDKLRLGRRLTKDDMVRWQKILFRRGWGAGMWPQRFGGAGWNVVQQHIFEEECAAANAPPQIPFSLRMVAPVIMAFGNERQQQYFGPEESQTIPSKSWDRRARYLVHHVGSQIKKFIQCKSLVARNARHFV